MEIYALVTFAVAAVGGLYLASKVLRGNFAPWAVSLIHAGLGAIGLLLLITAYLERPSNVVVPLLILLIAAIGGFFLASFHLRKKLPPKTIVLVHAVVAVIGVLSLAVVGLA